MHEGVKFALYTFVIRVYIYISLSLSGNARDFLSETFLRDTQNNRDNRVSPPATDLSDAHPNVLTADRAWFSVSLPPLPLTPSRAHRAPLSP